MKVLKLELSQEHIELLEKFIKTDRKFVGNEDLYEDFFAEASSRAVALISTITDVNAVSAYLKKIVSTSIIVVLKNSGRVRRTKDNFVPTNEVQLASNYPEMIADNSCNNNVVNYDFIDFSPSSEEIVVQRDILQRVYDSVMIAHSTNIAKQFLDLYELRYVQGKKQSEIARELNLSQSEVSKRLFELMEQVKMSLEM